MCASGQRHLDKLTVIELPFYMKRVPIDGSKLKDGVLEVVRTVNLAREIAHDHDQRTPKIEGPGSSRQAKS